jgi:hypothetical protein
VRHSIRLVAVLLLLTLSGARAWADATAFVGVSTSPETRPTVGFGIGIGLLIVGFEFEYAHTREEIDGGSLAPSVRTFMGNVLLQTPGSINGVQLYATTGAGPYRVAFDPEFARANRLPTSDLRFGTNIGGGVKLALAGPIRLRLDYRVFFIEGPLFPGNSHRFYAGLNLAF